MCVILGPLSIVLLEASLQFNANFVPLFPTCMVPERAVQGAWDI